MLTLRALEWEHSDDLNAPPARWSCTFLESAGTGGLLPGENIPKSGYTRVRVNATIDGSTERLFEGIVREWGIRERPDGVVSTAEGIDLKATLLDYRPPEAVTYKGAELLSSAASPAPDGARKVIRLGSNSVGEDVKGAFFETFQTVAADVCSRVGLTPAFECRDYDLGQEVVWDTDTPANSILATLAQPFNLTERFKLDLFIEGNTARFAERGVAISPAVSVDYSRLLTREVRRFDYPPFNDVQVRGMVYRFIEPDVPAGTTTIMGAPNDAAYSFSYREVHEEAASGTDIDSARVADFQPIKVAETNGTIYYDADGRKIREASSKRYDLFIVRNPLTGAFIATFPRIRREDTVEEWEYGPDAPHGEATAAVKTVFVEDSTQYREVRVDESTNPPTVSVANLGAPMNTAQYVERTETRFVYGADGEPLFALEADYAAPEPRAADSVRVSAGLCLVSVREKRVSVTRGQRIVVSNTETFSRFVPGWPVGRISHTEILAGKDQPGETIYWRQTPNGPVGVWEAGKITSIPPLPAPDISAPGGKRWAAAQSIAGPDDAQIRYDLPMLITQADLEYFRGKIVQERSSARYEARLGPLPVLEVKPGVTLTVANAPARWERSTFYVFAARRGHRPRRMTQGATGLAWIDP